MPWLTPQRRARADAAAAKAAGPPAAPPAAGIGSDFGPDAMESAAEWPMIWARAIATAWGDEDFAIRLKRDPHEVILEEFGYILSPNFELEIVDGADDGQFDPDKLGRGEDPFEGLQKLKLTIAIPPAPAPDLQAVAITAYQDTGRALPFTCC